MSKLRSDDMKTELSQYLDTALRSLSNIWDDIGICDDQRRDRTTVVFRHLRNLLDEMVKEETTLKNKLMKNIDKFRDDLNKLCNALGLPKEEVDENTPILQMEKFLRNRVEELNTEKSSRFKKLKKLKEIEQHLCDILCSTPYYIPTGTVPTSAQLTELEQHIASLEKEKEDRMLEFRTSRSEIAALLDDLGQCPNTSFERDALCEEEASFLLSTENMKALQTFQKKLQEKHKQNQALAKKLRDHVSQLWERLLIPEHERKDFNEKHTGYKQPVLQALQEEIDRCEQLKMANIQRVIEGARRELDDWWDACYYSKMQRDMFVPYYDEDYTEELLQAHDLEVCRLKDYYREHQHILERVAKREKLWTELLEFEKRAADPNRFFNDRGGKLLKEEKARKKLTKDLPKVEQELTDFITEWELQSGKEFLVEGVRFIDYIKRQWQEHEKQKENEKRARVKNRAKITEEEMVYGSKPVTPANKRRYIGTPSQTPNSKLRKLNETPRTPKTPLSNTKHLSVFHKLNDTQRTPGASRMNAGSIFHSPMGKAPKSTTKRTPYNNRSRTQRKALSEKSNNNEHTMFSRTTTSTMSHPSHDNISTASVQSTGTYQDFALGLNHNARPFCRSSVLVPENTPFTFKL